MLCKRSNYPCAYIAHLSPALNGSSEISRFKRKDAIAIRNGIKFVFYPGLPHTLTTVDREIFVLKYFRGTIFRGVKFSLSGPSTKIYHQVHITATRAFWLVASAFIVKFGRQLLQKYSCERATAAKDGTRCGGKRMHRYRWNGHRTL